MLCTVSREAKELMRATASQTNQSLKQTAVDVLGSLRSTLAERRCLALFVRCEARTPHLNSARSRMVSRFGEFITVSTLL